MVERGARRHRSITLDNDRGVVAAKGGVSGMGNERTARYEKSLFNFGFRQKRCSRITTTTTKHSSSSLCAFPLFGGEGWGRGRG